METVASWRGTARQAAERVGALWRGSSRARVAIVGGTFALMLLMLGLVQAWASPRTGPGLVTQHVSGVFADVNGDGLTDFIVNAEVIVNRGPLAHTP